MEILVIFNAPLPRLYAPARPARDKTGAAMDKVGTSRDKTGTARDKTGTGA